MYSDGIITLAPFERSDLPQVRAWVNDVALCRAIDRVLPVTELEHERWYEALILKQDAVTFAIRRAGTLIGLCGLSHIHPRHHHGELWIYLGPATERGQGHGRQALRLLARFGFEQLNLHRIHLFVVSDNAAAIAAYKACGFQEEGRAREHIFAGGKYVDAVRMGLLRADLI